MGPHHPGHQFPALLTGRERPQAGIQIDGVLVVRDLKVHDEAAVEAQAAQTVPVECQGGPGLA